MVHCVGNPLQRKRVADGNGLCISKYGSLYYIVHHIHSNPTVLVLITRECGKINTCGGGDGISIIEANCNWSGMSGDKSEIAARFH